MAIKKKTRKAVTVDYSPNKVTFGIALLAVISIFALAILLFTAGR